MWGLKGSVVAVGGWETVSLLSVIRKKTEQPGKDERGNLQDTKTNIQSLSSMSGTIQCRTRPESVVMNVHQLA